MPLYTLSGTAAGVGSATFGPGVINHFVHASLLGAATVTSSGVTERIFTGRVVGSGTLSDDLLALLEGTTTGAGTVTGMLSHTINMRGQVVGAGQLNISLPEPMIGVGTIAGFLNQQRVPEPLCDCRRCRRCAHDCGCHTWEPSRLFDRD